MEGFDLGLRRRRQFRVFPVEFKKGEESARAGLVTFTFARKMPARSLLLTNGYGELPATPKAGRGAPLGGNA
jgi:hypothetical protein